MTQWNFSVNSFPLWSEGLNFKFAIRNCEKRRLLFAALPDIDLAKIILFFFVCFFLGVKEEILCAQNRLLPSRYLHLGWATR